MRFDRRLDVFVISLLCTVASLTFSNAEVKGHAEGQENPCHPESLVSPKSKSCLEEELKELRDSVDVNRQLIDSLEKRGEHAKDGQPEFADSDLHTTVTESHSVSPEVDDLTDVRRYSTTTLRTVDVEEPIMEDSGDDDDIEDGDDEEVEDAEETGGRPVPQKRSGGDDDDDDEDSDEDDDDDDDDDEDDDDEDGEMRRKKMNGMGVETSTASATSSSIDTSTGTTLAETSTPSTEGETTTAGVATTTRDALLSRFDAFLERDKKSGARGREADFEGVGKLKQIREIDKRVDQKLKEKYINAVEPHADEQLLELMVKIAENPRDWNAVHAMLQQLDEDIAVVQQIENEAKNLENKRDDNGVETKSKTRKLTKEERKQQQADKKKKKKKKKQRQKEKLAREQKLREEEEDKSRLAVETLRRQQLERAGLLNAAGRTMKDQGRQVKPTTVKTTMPTTTPTPTSTTTTTSTTTSTTTVPPVATTWLPKELQGSSKLQPHGASNQMKTLDSAIDVLSKDHARIVLNPAQWPRPKSPMQEVREKWPKALSNLERPINTAKAIVTGRLRPSADDDDDRPRTTSESNEWSKADIASVVAEDKERARERFLTETVYAKNNVVHWKPNAKAKWLETLPLPSKEHRASSHNTYFNGEPSRKQPDNGWPDFSLNALKHGNIDATNEEVVIAEQSGQDVWPNLPADADRDWPEITSNTIDADRVNGWNRKQQAMSNNWPGISHSKALEHAKEVAGSKQWPHFAYHRVTSSPLQSRQRQQQEAQQRARHRNAYIAVSIISPPKNRSTARNATAAAAAGTQEATAKEATVNETRQLPDKMDELLDQRSELTRKLTPVDPLEEQLIDMAASGTDPRSKFNWSHSRHLDKIQEQLKTLSAMEAKLQAQWLEKERLRQILRDGGKSGSYYRDVRSDVQRVAVGAAGAAGAASSFDTNQTSDA